VRLARSNQDSPVHPERFDNKAARAAFVVYALHRTTPMAPVTLLGVPWDGSSSFQTGAAEAPQAIRQALRSPSSNFWNERGDDVSSEDVLVDAGDLTLPEEAAAARQAIQAGARAHLRDGRRLLVLGGDHSITFPVLKAFVPRSEAVTVLHLDAHADLYDHFNGDRYSHASVFARVMEEQLASRLIQVGIRTLTAHQRSQAAKLGVEILGADRWREAAALVGRIRGPLYVSLDIDVLEPMLAPAVSHPEPGGLTVRDVLEVLSAVRVPVVGADIVEYNPRNDMRDLTARVAAKFVKELVGVMRR
jgi:arginase